MTDEAQVILIWQALCSLAQKNKAWNRNVEVFRDMDTPRRLWWWAHVKRQADLGSPAMQTLVLAVIKQRMIG